MEPKAQVVIHNVTSNSQGKSIEKVLSISASELTNYVKRLAQECDTVFEPERSKKFDHLPLLCIKDSYDTQEEFYFKTPADLPPESVKNSKGREVLVVLPEDCPVRTGVNLFHLAKPLVPDNASDNPETLSKRKAK